MQLILAGLIPAALALAVIYWCSQDEKRRSSTDSATQAKEDAERWQEIEKEAW